MLEHIAAGFFTADIPESRIMAYVDARVSLSEAVEVWEPKAEGEDIDAALAALVALGARSVGDDVFTG